MKRFQLVMPILSETIPLADEVGRLFSSTAGLDVLLTRWNVHQGLRDGQPVWVMTALGYYGLECPAPPQSSPSSNEVETEDIESLMDIKLPDVLPSKLPQPHHAVRSAFTAIIKRWGGDGKEAMIHLMAI